jgi:hypothetical protein
MATEVVTRQPVCSSHPYLAGRTRLARARRNAREGRNGEGAGDGASAYRCVVGVTGAEQRQPPGRQAVTPEWGARPGITSGRPGFAVEAHKHAGMRSRPPEPKAVTSLYSRTRFSDPHWSHVGLSLGLGSSMAPNGTPPRARRRPGAMCL